MAFRAYGLYLIQQSVQYCGRLVYFESYGIISAQVPEGTSLLQVLTYQKLCDGTFRETSRNTINTDHLDNITGYVSLNLNVAVQGGDLIGVRIHPLCMQEHQCFFQPAIESNTSTEVYYNENIDINKLQPRTGVFLNVRASIGNSTLHDICRSSATIVNFLLEPQDLQSCPVQVSDYLPLVQPTAVPIEQGLSQKRYVLFL